MAGGSEEGAGERMLTQQFLWQALWAPGSLPTPRTVLLCEGGRQVPQDVKGLLGEAGSLGSLEDLGRLTGHRVFWSR